MIFTRNVLIVSVIGLVAMIGSGIAWAEFYSGRHEVLRKLDGVAVVVERVPVGSTDGNIDCTSVANAVKAQLKSSGIRVLTQDEAVNSNASPFVFIRCGVIPVKTAAGERSGYAFMIQFLMKQTVSLGHDPQSSCHAITWDEARYGTTAGANLTKTMNDCALQMTDKFSHDFLRANPKK